MIKNVMLVSGAPQSGSVLHIHVSSFQILSPYGLLQNVEWSSLCYTVSPCWLSVLYIVVCVCDIRGYFSEFIYILSIQSLIHEPQVPASHESQAY